jgi:pantoate--beta-alanine ligase
MRIARTIAELSEMRREAILELLMDRPGRPIIGLVPTMGALHAGHASLMQRMNDECQVRIASIFVNPLQFGTGEDLDTYPRPIEADLDLCRSFDLDVVFVPGAAEIYPPAFATSVSVPTLAGMLEGAVRPGHFDGVATVVTKLLALAAPERAYFGEKDYQQLCIVRRLTADLGLHTSIVACPTVREADGLALSSRNAYLTPHQRGVAVRLHACLSAMAEEFARGQHDTQLLISHGASLLRGWEEDDFELDYLVVADPHTLAVRDTARRGDRVLIGAKLGTTRLIDNVELTS